MQNPRRHSQDATDGGLVCDSGAADRVRRLRWCALIMACTLLACGACSRPESATLLRTRFIAPDADPPAAGTPTHAREEVFRWEFEQASDLTPWTPYRMDLKFQIQESTLLTRSSDADAHIRRSVDLAAADVDEIQVVGSPLIGASRQLFWHAPGSDFSEPSSLRIWTPEPDGKLLQTVTFHLRDHPQWRGRIAGLRFDLTDVAQHRAAVHSIAGYRYRLDPAHLEALASRPQRVDFQNREFLALLAPPGVRASRTLEIDRGSRLHFAYGLEQRSGPRITFDVRFSPENGPEEAAWSATLDPATDARTWHDASVDLARWSGRRGTLTLVTQAAGDFDPRAGFPLWAQPEVVGTGAPERMNVVWILLDTLRADRVSAYGYGRPTTPRIDAFARSRGVLFQNAIAPAPWTLPSHVSMFSGLGPLRHGVNYNLPAPDTLLMLPEWLRQHGYVTAAFTGGAFVRPSFGLGQGFDQFAYFQEAADKRGPSIGKDLATTLARTKAWLTGAAAEPFFLFFHTYQLHAPYLPQQPWANQFLGKAVPPDVVSVSTVPVEPALHNGWQQSSRHVVVRTGGQTSPASAEQQSLIDALYDSGIASSDAAVGELLDSISALGMDRRTLIIISSDHGESLGEHGGGGHYDLYDQNLRVPLVIAWPDGRQRGTRIATQVRLIDLASTITQSLGLPPLPDAEGQSLLPLLADAAAPFPAEAESYAASTNQGFSLRVGNRSKFITQHSVWGDRKQLFDLVTDPGEHTNRAPDDVALAAAQLSELERRYRAKASSLVIEAHNALGTPLPFRLRGAIAHAFRAKAFETPAGAIEWSQGDIVVRTPAHSSLRFFLEGDAFGQLLVRLHDPHGVKDNLAFSDVLEIETLETPAAYLLDQRWRRSSASVLPSEATGLTIRWQRKPRMAAPLAPRNDAQLHEQLKALGYVK